MATLKQLMQNLSFPAGDDRCEQCFEHLGQLVEERARGSVALSAAAAHVRSCPACREDAEGLLALITADKTPDRTESRR
jgi:uncharacterized protein with PIN domain